MSMSAQLLKIFKAYFNTNINFSIFFNITFQRTKLDYIVINNGSLIFFLIFLQWNIFISTYRLFNQNENKTPIDIMKSKLSSHLLPSFSRAKSTLWHCHVFQTERARSTSWHAATSALTTESWHSVAWAGFYGRDNFHRLLSGSDGKSRTAWPMANRQTSRHREHTKLSTQQSREAGDIFPFEHVFGAREAVVR